MRTAQWNDAVSVIDRVTLVLGCFRAEDKRLGVSELARRANLPKSTVSRLVSELVEHRYLEREGTGVRLGLRLFELGELAVQPNELRKHALSAMADLRDATGHTVYLAVLDGLDAVCIGVIRGHLGVPALHARVGSRVPATSTAAGAALLACAQRQGIRADDFQGDVAAPVLHVDETGLAVEHEAGGTRITGVASAILAGGHHPVAAIAVSGPAGSVDAASIGPAVRTAALSLGRSLAPATTLP